MKDYTHTTDSIDLKAVEQTVLALNHRLASRALNLWQGNESRFSHSSLYDDLGDVLDPTTITKVRGLAQSMDGGRRVFHALLGHYLQYRLFPYENELFTWMKGAAANVDDEKIYFKDILSWCQKRSDLHTRRLMERETSSLCKFLKPFSLGFWEYLLQLLKEQFGYSDYATYCKDKKQLDYDTYVSELPVLLQQTDTLYFEAMGSWTRKTLGIPLAELNRFDGIYLLGLGEFDHLFPNQLPLREHLSFFNQWEIEIENMSGIHLHTAYSPKKGSQAVSFALQIPGEIHLVMNPHGGWIDLETLFHELGHVLGNAFTSPELSLAEKDFFTSNTLSETYAFLLQDMSSAPPFLMRQLDLSSKTIEEVTYYKALKDLSIFRRYASKFLAEYEMFKENDLASGNTYCRLLKKYTGFSYRPETQLFDLVPEFYALDYVISWMAEATMEKVLRETLGEDWMFQAEAGKILRDWWRCGNRYELDEFFAVQGIGPVNPADIVNRWQQIIGKKEGEYKSHN